MRTLFAIIVVWAISLYNANAQNNLVLPEFPGGDSVMYTFLTKEISSYALTDGMKPGRVALEFTVKKDGNLDNIAVIQGVNAVSDSLAVEIVRSMPKWKPGLRDGKVADISSVLFIVFRSPDAEANKLKAVGAPNEERWPEFRGGTDSLHRYIARNLKYPVIARHPEPQGRVAIRFTVLKNGEITDPKILRGVDEYLDREAIRLVMSMPKWIPAEQAGVAVESYFTLPVLFKLP